MRVAMRWVSDRSRGRVRQEKQENGNDDGWMMDESLRQDSVFRFPSRT
jgi:hypothetical protein